MGDGGGGGRLVEKWICRALPARNPHSVHYITLYSTSVVVVGTGRSPGALRAQHTCLYIASPSQRLRGHYTQEKKRAEEEREALLPGPCCVSR